MAGARDLVLQLYDGTNTYTFSYDGRLAISQEYQYNENPEPPVLRQIVERWTITAARIQGNTVEATMDAWQTFLTHTEDIATTPLTTALLVRDPDGTPVTERTLGGAVHEGFRLESLEFGNDPVPELEPAEFRTIVPVTMVLAAFREFSDSNGISAFEQTVRNSYTRAGLHTLEWETSISTADGAATSALTLGESYAVIPIATYGNSYVWDTNGSRGFDWEELDADTRDTPDKQATKLRFISRIRQLGLSPGTPSAGNSLGDANKTTTINYEGGKETTTVEASAEGPGAFAWVTAQRPSGNLSSWMTRNEEGTRLAFARYVVEETPDGKMRREIHVAVTGGYEDFEFVPISGGHRPRRAIGPLRELRADISVRITFSGARPSTSQMPFPPELTDPWYLNRNLSREDSVPRLQSAGVDSGADRWVREAQLVYLSDEAPENVSVDEFLPLFQAINAGPDVSSYLLESGGL